MRFLKFAFFAVPTLALAACAYPDTGSVVVLDEADNSYMSRVLQGTLENNKSGQSANWINPGNNHRGTVTPLRTFKSETGQDCREFQRLATIEGKTGFAYGTACREPDGPWWTIRSTGAREYYTTITPYYDRGPSYSGYVGYGSGYGHYGRYRHHYGSGISLGFGHYRYY